MTQPPIPPSRRGHCKGCGRRRQLGGFVAVCRPCFVAFWTSRPA